MTSSVTGLSIFYGLSSALDTLLPAAWTSGNPEFVGLWTQRCVSLNIARRNHVDEGTVCSC